MNFKTCLISQAPLPYSRISSWPKRFDYYLSKFEKRLINTVICPSLDFEEKHSGVEYLFVTNTLAKKVYQKFIKKRHFYFSKKAIDLIKKEKKFIIFLIVDNTGLLFELNESLIKNKIRDKVKIIFFSAGFSYFFDSKKIQTFFDGIDTFVCQSEKSYQFELDRTHCITSKVSILPNGIDLKKFFQVDSKRKDELKHALGIKDKIVFLWCANERPKKGLHILLDAWCNSSLFKNDIFELLIIGTRKIGTHENIRFLGRIPNNDLPKYYQVTDYYLFTTLCHEGFPLSLTEAIACGSKCVVSQIDPLPDIFQKFGNITFVENPNIVASWIEKLELAASGVLEFDELNHALIHHELSLETWCNRINEIIISEVKSIQSTNI